MAWKPIVAGVDGSPESLRAAALAWRIAEAGGAKCYFVFAAPEPWPGGVEPLHYPPRIYDQLVADVRRLLDDGLGGEIPAAGREALVVRSGRPGVVLADVAKERGAELVVVGGRHHGALMRSLGGSTAHYLVRTLDTPVLVVGPGARPMRRVLVAADLSEAARPALAAARRYADVLGAQLRGLHVVEPAKYPLVVPLLFDEAEYERRCRKAFERLAPPPDHVVRQGIAVDVIAEEAARWEADLIVVGSHGKGWAHRMLIGSSTERLLNLLPASLLVVPVLRPARRRPVRARRARTGRARGPRGPKGKVIV